MTSGKRSNISLKFIVFNIILSHFRVATSHNLPVDEMLKNLQEKLENDINEIKEELKVIPEMEDKCKDLKVLNISK
jgi:hypothetical protein